MLYVLEFEFHVKISNVWTKWSSFWFTINVYVFFSDINECATTPCFFLFDCYDQINDYICKLNMFKLVAVVSALSLTTAIIIFIICKNKKQYKDVDHSW